MSNILTVSLAGDNKCVKTKPLYQYDYGQILKITGIDLPSTYQVDFGNEVASGTSKTMIGSTSEGVEIPNEYLDTGFSVYAWLVLHNTEDDGETKYTIEIPVIRRARPTSESPTPTQQSAIDQLIAQIQDEIAGMDDMIDDTLSEVGKAADAKAVGDEIQDVKTDVEDLKMGSSGLSNEVKNALLQLAAKVAYIDDDGDIYYQNLHDALYPLTPATSVTLNMSSINTSSVGGTQQLTATIIPANTSESVSWTSSDDHVATVSDNGLVTIVDYGTALITVHVGSVSAACSVVVSQSTLSSITAAYTQSGTVYDTDSLDSLKNNLVVTAHWSNSTTSEITGTNYTLSGTLTEGTSTITVSYGGKTATFTVTVTHNDSALYSFNDISGSGSGRSIQITNGNHIRFVSTVNSKYMYCTWTKAASAWSSKAANPLFTLSPTDELQLTIKNIEYSGNTVGSKIHFALMSSTEETVIRSSNNVTLPATQTAIADNTRTVEVGTSGDVGIGIIQFYAYRPVTWEADIELYVNGVRYI